MTSVSAWLPFVRATAIGWVPLAKKPMPMPFVQQDKCPSDSKLVINVSGFHFETWRHTVERFPDSLLGSDEKEYFFDPTNEEYFFDRNPDLFRFLSYFHYKFKYAKLRIVIIYIHTTINLRYTNHLLIDLSPTP